MESNCKSNKIIVIFFRVAAFDHISNKLCGRLESFLYNEKEERLKQVNNKREEKTNVEKKQKEDSQAIQIADSERKVLELLTGYELLQSEFNTAEKKLESLTV